MSPFHSLSLLAVCLLHLAEASQIRETKIRDMFASFDTDNDGLLTLTDFAEKAKKFADKAKLNKEKKKELQEKQIPELFAAFKFDKKGVGKPMSVDELVATVEEHIDDPKFKNMVKTYQTLLFKAIDVDSNGSIGTDEFGSLYEALVASPKVEVTKIVFDAIDTNKDGNISPEEFQIGGAEFFFGEDENNPINTMLKQP